MSTPACRRQRIPFEPVYWSVRDQDDDVCIADELLNVDAALSVATRTGGVVWAHGLMPRATRMVRCEVVL